MRLIWSNENSWFQAEYQRDDVEFLKAAKFKTGGPPNWIWYAAPPGIVALDRLRKNPPKSGLVISELALEKYTGLKEQFDKKVELKKTFTKLKQAAQRDQVKRPEYEKDGFVSFVVESKDTAFVQKFTIASPPSQWCFVCGDPVYEYEGTDLCLWCAEKF